MVKEEIKQMLQMNVIEPSNSPYCAPLLMVRKKDDTFRSVIDFRQLNRITRFDSEPIPNPDEIFAKLAGKCYFSKLDFCKGYWQIGMSTEDKEKTAFAAPNGLFHFRRMPFGLVNSGATYTRMMRILLAGLENVDNYIDDVLIHSDSWESHLATLEQVFARVRDANLTVKPSKCSLGCQSVDYVGHRVANGCLKTQEDKIIKIRDAAVPTNKTQLRAFLGLTGYYRKFVPNYADVAVCLTDMTKKGRPEVVKWCDEAEVAFNKLKEMLCSRLVLRLPDFARQFVIRTDASNVGVGAVLLQRYEDTLHPVAYASKRLTPAQERYATIERECWAIIWSLQRFYVYVYGRHFVVQTDHQPLTYLNSAKHSNGRLMRWALLLQPFRFTVEAIPGSENVGADYLSRI